MQKFKKVNENKKIKNIIYVILGCFIFSISVNCFTAPNAISPGGIVGIGQIISDFTGISNGMLCILLNIPIFIFGSKKFGFKNIIKNVFVALFLYILMDVTAIFLPVYLGNQLIACILAGFIGGIGLAMIFVTGLSTAGTGLLSVIISDYVPYISIGSIILFLDGTIVLVSALIYGTKDGDFNVIVSKIVYAAIILFIQSKVMDSIIVLREKVFGKSMSIISPQNDAILNKIENKIDAKFTLIESKGAYSNKEGTALVGKVKTKDLDKAYKIIESVDKSAFIIVGDIAS